MKTLAGRRNGSGMFAERVIEPPPLSKGKKLPHRGGFATNMFFFISFSSSGLHLCDGQTGYSLRIREILTN